MILKRANSSYYGGARATADLQSAVVRLGFKECRQLVIGLSVFNLFSRQEQSFGFNRLWYWLHSIACGWLAKQLAGKTHLPNQEDAFTAGLLHDIGKIVLDDFLNPTYQKVVRTAYTERIALYAAEEKILQRNHALVGSAVLRRWQFPTAVCRAVGEHHDAGEIFARQQLDLTGVVLVANQIAKALMVGAAGDFIVQDLPRWVWERCGLDELVSMQFLDEFYDELLQFCSFLQIQAAEVEHALDRRRGAGTAVVVDPQDAGTRLLGLFLANQGFAVERCSDPEQLGSLEQGPDLCLLRLTELEAFEAVINQMQQRGKTVPTVCIVPPDFPLDRWAEGPASVRCVPLPVDCFVLAAQIRELIPGGCSLPARPGADQAIAATEGREAETSRPDRRDAPKS